MNGKRPVWCAGICVILFLGLSGCVEQLEGPERFEFDNVREVSFAVDRGEVQVFGSTDINGAVLDRWNSERESFETLEQRKDGTRLSVEARCNGTQSCRARYDSSVDRTARVEVSLEEGEVELIRLGGPVKVSMEEGTVRGSSLGAERFELDQRHGQARLSFNQAPAHLILRVVNAEVVVQLPDERFVCDFDRNGEQVGMGGLRCHDMVDRRITLDPPDARVRFEVR